MIRAALVTARRPSASQPVRDYAHPAAGNRLLLALAVRHVTAVYV